MRSKTRVLFLAIVVFGWLAAGCGGIKIDDSTPEGLVDTIAKLIQASRYEDASELFDYDNIAEAKNPDWYTFSTTQRNQIIESMRKENTLTLSDWARLQGDLSGISGELLNAQGDTARGSIKVGGQDKVRVKMRKVGEKWRVSEFYPL